MVRRLIPPLFGFIFIALVSPALAEGPGMFYGRGGMGGPGFFMQGENPMRILQGIKLTPDQETQVRNILEKKHADLRDLFDQLRAAQDALTTKLLSPGALSDSDMKPLLARTLQARQQLAERSLATMLEVRAVLTRDQLAQAASKRARIIELENQLRELEKSD
jgi:Spy/CpxP family protein refolding chaperone